MSSSHYVYRITNLINGKYYIGVHNGSKANYFGSGKLIAQAVRKYGRENFKKEILLYAKDADDAYDMESVLVTTKDKDPMSYNIDPGGRGNSNLGSKVVDLKIGIHAATFEERSEWSKKTQASVDPTRRLEMCSRGGKRTAELGKAGFQTVTKEQRLANSQKANETKRLTGNCGGFSDPEVQRRNGIKGGKAHKGLRTYTDGIREFKFKSSDPLNKELTEKEFKEFLSTNSGFSRGRKPGFTSHTNRNK